MFPKLKKKIKSFLLSEEGKISKQSIITIGSILTISGFAETVNASHLCPPAVSCSCGACASKAACDNSQPGWVRDYNATYYVTCASGSPQPKIEIEASVSCESGTLIKVIRIVVYNGKPVKLVVAVCG